MHVPEWAQLGLCPLPALTSLDLVLQNSVLLNMYTI